MLGGTLRLIQHRGRGRGEKQGSKATTMWNMEAEGSLSGTREMGAVGVCVAVGEIVAVRMGTNCTTQT